MRSDHLAKHVKTHANVSRKNKKAKEDEKEEAAKVTEKPEQPMTAVNHEVPVSTVGSANYGTVPVASGPKPMSINYAAVAPNVVPSANGYNTPTFSSGSVMSSWYPEVRQESLYARAPVRDHRMYQQYPAPISSYQCATKENYAVFQGHYNFQHPVALGQ